MNDGQVMDSDNRYCRRLGIALPGLDAALTKPDLTLTHVVALALLEAGGPLSLEAVAERLARLALPPRLAAAGRPASLRKALHGQPPVVRDPVGFRIVFVVATFWRRIAPAAFPWIQVIAGVELSVPSGGGSGVSEEVHLRNASAWYSPHVATAGQPSRVRGLPAVAHLRKVASRKVSEGWWRRRESNPRPKVRRRGNLQACPVLEDSRPA